MRSTIAFGIGAVVEAGLAMLFRPKSIELIRQDLANRVNGSLEREQAKVREITSHAIRVADKVKDQVHRAQDAVDAGIRAFKAGSHRSS